MQPYHIRHYRFALHSKAKSKATVADTMYYRLLQSAWALSLEKYNHNASTEWPYAPHRLCHPNVRFRAGVEPGSDPLMHVARLFGNICGFSAVLLRLSWPIPHPAKSISEKYVVPTLASVVDVMMWQQQRDDDEQMSGNVSKKMWNVYKCAQNKELWAKSKDGETSYVAKVFDPTRGEELR